MGEYTAIDSKQLIGIDQALNLSQKDVENNYYEYINPQLIRLFRILNFNRVFLKAQGTRLWDEQGREYVDFLGGYGSLNVGHNNQAIIEGIGKVVHIPNILQAALHPLTSALAKNLANITPGELQYTFFCNSGAEAVEGALKLAKIATGKSRIIYCKGSFHGKSMGALSVTGRNKYKKYFSPLIPLTNEVQFGKIEDLRDILESYDDIAAFIVEPIQGEGGIVLPPKGYLKKAKELCQEYGVLLIADEVQTGFGRTGNWFACEEEGINPDILCMAKALSGGLIPIGAYIATENVWKRGYGSIDRCLLHTSTFGGNAWACAAALSTIEYIDTKGLIDESKEKGAYFLTQLSNLMGKHPLIKEIRGRGLMIGIEFKSIHTGVFKPFTQGENKELLDEYVGGVIAGELLNHYGIITAYTLNNPNVIRVEPPLTISYDEIDYFVTSLDKALDKHKGLSSMMISNAKNVVKSFFTRRI